MSLKKQTISGVKWNSFSAGFNAVMAIAKTAILARLLSPSDFGLMAMIEGIVIFGAPLADMGIGSAIIQEKNVSHKQLSTLYWLNVFLGITVFFVMVFASPFVADFYNEERLNSLLVLAALSFLIGPFGSQFNILFQKELNFSLPVKIDFVSNIVSFIVAIYVAYIGWGVYALIYGRLARVAVSSVVMIFFGLKIHRPGFYFNLKEVKSLLSFGSFNMAERYAQVLGGSWDKILIGKLLGAELLGFYNIAYTMIVTPMMTINPVITKVAFPVFSKIKESKEQINSYYHKALSVLMAINFPLYIGIALVANEFILIFFGEKWAPSVPIMQILAIEVLYRSIGNPGGSIVKAKGRADISFYWSLIRSFAVLGCILAAYYIHSSLISIAIGILVSRYTFGSYWHFVIMKIGGIDYGPIIKDAIKIASFSAIMALSIFTINNLYPIENAIFKFAINISLGIIVYSGLILKFDRKNKDLILELRK